MVTYGQTHDKPYQRESRSKDGKEVNKNLLLLMTYVYIMENILQ